LKTTSQILPSDIIHIIKALTPVLVPTPHDLPMPDLSERVAERATGLIFHFSRLFRLGLIWNLRFFNWLPIFFGFGRLTFLQLKKEQQEEYIGRWASHRIFFFRELFQPMKALVIMMAFSDERVWQYIGYEPYPHLKERIKMREEYLQKQSVENTN